MRGFPGGAACGLLRWLASLPLLLAGFVADSGWGLARFGLWLLLSASSVVFVEVPRALPGRLNRIWFDPAVAAVLAVLPLYRSNLPLHTYRGV